MINWEKENEDFFTVVSAASDMIHLEKELTATIAKIIELNLYSKGFVEFYSDATNGSFFINQLNENKEPIDDSKTVHFCALKIWEDYDDSNKFDADMKKALHHSIDHILTQQKMKIPFSIVLRDEQGYEEEIAY